MRYYIYVRVSAFWRVTIPRVSKRGALDLEDSQYLYVIHYASIAE